MHCAMAVAFRERWALRQVGLGRGHCLGARALYVLRVDQAPQPTGESVNAQMPQTPAMSAQMSASAFVGGQSPSAQQQQNNADTRGHDGHADGQFGGSMPKMPF